MPNLNELGCKQCQHAAHIETPGDIDPGVLVNGTTHIQTPVPQAHTVFKNQDYTTVMGFIRGVGNNITETLQPRYYKQLYKCIFKISRIVSGT